MKQDMTWQESQALTRLLKQTDNEVALVNERLRALHTRRNILKKNLNKSVEKQIA